MNLNEIKGNRKRKKYTHPNYNMFVNSETTQNRTMQEEKHKSNIVILLSNHYMENMKL